jgi:hypothetical protein
VKRHHFTAPTGEVLENLRIGLRVMAAERDVRSDKPDRIHRGRQILAAVPARDLTPEPCKDADPEAFFPYAGPENVRVAETAEALLAQAREVCAGCSVAAACLQGAIDRGEEYGVWAGRDFATDRAIKQQIKTSRQRSAS